MWPEDYAPVPGKSVPYLDLFPEDWPEDRDEDEDDILDEEDVSDSAQEQDMEVCWRVQIEYTNQPPQEIVSYQNFLTDRPEELYFALLDYFEPDIDDFENEDEDYE